MSAEEATTATSAAVPAEATPETKENFADVTLTKVRLMPQWNVAGGRLTD